MKKVFAALAAGAVAVSVFGLTACGGGSKGKPSGAIPGDYEQKTPEELGQILDENLNGLLDGGYENLLALDKYNYGLKIDLDGSYSQGKLMSAEGEVYFDFKLQSTKNGLIGAGSTDLSASLSSQSGSTNFDFEGEAYWQNSVIYASGTGAFDKDKFGGKVSIDVNQILDAVESIVGNDTSATVDEDISDDSASNSFDIMGILKSYLNSETLLKYADEFKIDIGVDNKDGLKLKVSVTEDSVWAIVNKFTGYNEETLGELVKINDFLFEVYLSLDKDGVLTGASVLSDISITLDGALGELLGGGSDMEGPSTTASVSTTPDYPDIKVKLYGSIELYTHTSTVTVPNIAYDEYEDQTGYILGTLGRLL